jgi:hypothetical protein
MLIKQTDMAQCGQGRVLNKDAENHKLDFRFTANLKDDYCLDQTTRGDQLKAAAQRLALSTTRSA